MRCSCAKRKIELQKKELSEEVSREDAGQETGSSGKREEVESI